MAAETQQVEILVTANTQQARTELDKLKGTTEQASTALQKQGDAAGKGTQTLVNFNRVVQDAPYGLMGIANNIDPLVTSFNALRAETGSVGGALKLLGSSLMGPAGFISIISIATSAFIAFKQGAEKAKKPVDELKKSIDKFIEVKNPFEDIIFKFDPKNLDAAIKQVQYKLGTLKNQVRDAKSTPSAEQLADPNFNGAAYAANMYKTQTSLVPRITILEKLLVTLQGMKKEMDLDLQVLKELGATLDGASVKGEKAPDSSGKDSSSPKEAVKNIRESVENLLKLAQIQGDTVTRTQYLEYFKQLSGYMKTLKKDSDDYIETLEYANKIFAKTGLMDGEQIRILPRGVGGLEPYEISKDLREKLRDKIAAGNDVRRKVDEAGLKELKDAAKKEYEVYDQYFIRPFADAFRGEFSKAWNSIFGEATSLFEKFIQGVAEQLFNYGVQKAAFGLLNLIVPGAGEIGAAIGGGGGGGSRPIQVIVDGELMATQKMASRTKAIINRTASLK